MIRWYEIPEPSLEPPEEEVEKEAFDEDRAFEERREQALFQE